MPLVDVVFKETRSEPTASTQNAQQEKLAEKCHCWAPSTLETCSLCTSGRSSSFTTRTTEYSKSVGRLEPQLRVSNLRSLR